jgi:hypothetical protein
MFLFIVFVTINQQLKIKIILDFILGIKREIIAKKYGISTGSVSAIAEEFDEEIPDLFKIRAMMIKLNATGYSPKTFYHAIRLHSYIEKEGLTEEQVEKILEIFQEFAFKENYNISELFDSIINAFNIAKKCGTDLEHLKDYANATAMVVESKKAVIRKLNNDVEFLPHKLNIDLADYQEYQKNKPIFQKYINMANELDIQNRRNQLLEDKVKTLESEVYEKDVENKRLNQLLSQRQEKKEDGYYIDYQQDIANLDSTDCLVEDSNDVEDDKNDSL